MSHKEMQNIKNDRIELNASDSKSSCGCIIRPIREFVKIRNVCGKKLTTWAANYRRVEFCGKKMEFLRYETLFLFILTDRRRQCVFQRMFFLHFNLILIKILWMDGMMICINKGRRLAHRRLTMNMRERKREMWCGFPSHFDSPSELSPWSRDSRRVKKSFQ